MAASLNETLMATVTAVILAAATEAGERVTRGRVDAYGPEEIPAINLRRGGGNHEEFAGGADQAYFEFDVDCYVRGDDWETKADALHMQAHRALGLSAELPAFCRGLRCIRTQMQPEGGDETIGRLTATYQAKALVRIDNLTKAVR